MRLTWILLLVQLIPTVTHGQNPASIVGETQDCFAGKVIHPAKVEIYLFDSRKSAKIQTMVNDLRKQAPSGNEQNVQPFFELLERLKLEARRTKALGHVRSDDAGQFSFNGLNAETRVLLFGFAEREDDPGYYAYESLKLQPGRNSVTLDFSNRAACASR